MLMRCILSKWSSTTFCALGILLSISKVQAQTHNCNNLDFENCDFSTWRLYEATNEGTAVFGYANKQSTTEWGTVGEGNFGQTQISGDRYTLFGMATEGSFLIQRRNESYDLPLVYPGGSGNCTALIGDFFEDDAYIAMLEKNIQVTAEVNALILRYAVAMEDPGHTPQEQPYFSMKLFTQDGTEIDCVTYTAVAGDGQEGWIDIGGRYQVKPWSELYVPLNDYVGQELKLEIIAADCSQGGHAGFALVDIICVANEIKIAPLSGCDFPYKLSAPEGARAYEWSTGETTSSIEVDSVGDYSVRIIPFNGEDCAITVTTRVDSMPDIPLAVSPDPTLCEGDSVELSVSGLVNYTWSPALGLSDPNSDKPIATPDVTTTYTVIGTDPSGCTGQNEVTVNVRPKPAVQAGNDQTICEGDSVLLGGTSEGTISWSPSAFLSDSKIESPIAFPPITGTYTITATSIFGCESSDEVLVNVNPKPILDIGQDVEICAGDTAQLTVSGAPNYLWSPPTTLSDPRSANPTASPPNTTIYFVTGSSDEGCRAVESLTVTVNPLPPVNAGPDLTLCPFSQTPLEASGALSYVWTPAVGLSNPNIQRPMVNGIQEITYMVEGTDAKGCVNTDEIQIKLNDEFILDAGPDLTLCEGETSELRVAGGSNYVWTPSTGLSNARIPNPIANPTQTTKYIIEAIDPRGCGGIDSITINVIAKPNIDLGADRVICEGESLMLQGQGADSYEWSSLTGIAIPSPANPNLSITPPSDQQLVLMGRFGNGCEDRDTIEVRVNALPIIDAGPDQNACMNAETQLVATGANTYSWAPSIGLSNPNLANPIAMLSSTTTFTVTGTDEYGCMNTDEITLKIAEELTPFAGNDTSICQGDSVFLRGSGGTTYLWEPATGLSNPNIPNPIVTSDTSITYELTVFDNLGCTGFDQISIEVNPVPILDAGPDIAVCSGTDAQLFATGATWYAWTPRDYLDNAFVADPIVFPDTAITYTLFGISDAGCVDEDDLFVDYVESIIIDAGEDVTICEGDTTNLRATGGSNYFWEPPIGLSNSQLSNPQAFPENTVTYIVSAGNNIACSSEDTLTITVNPSPKLELPDEPVICAGDSVFVNVQGAESYDWAPANVGISNPQSGSVFLSPDQSQRYFITGSNSFGCEDTGSLYLVVNPIPVLDPGIYEPVCEGTSLQLDAKGAKYFSWDPPVGLSDPEIRDPMANPVESIVYTLNGIDQNGCSASVEVPIEVARIPIAEFNASDSLGVAPSNISFSNNSQFADSYQWYFGDGDSTEEKSPRHAYREPDQYLVYMVALNKLGCADTAIAAIEILPVKLLVPNAFTPNMDGFNETFYVGITEAISNLNVQIFDRWGKLIYESDELDFQWDGKFKGQDVPEGAYVAKVKAWDIEGRSYTQVTTVTVFR